MNKRYSSKLSELPKELQAKINRNTDENRYLAIAKSSEGKRFFITGYGRDKDCVVVATENGYTTYLYLDSDHSAGRETFEIEECDGDVSKVFETFGDTFELSTLPKLNFPDGVTNREKATIYEKDFFKRYEKLFKKGNLKQSLMGFGFGVGLGWYPILMTVFETVSKRLDEHPEMTFGFIQIKEKFGGLRMYYVGGDSVIERVVSWAEAKSERVCENCGKPGKPTDTGWIFTLCDECLEAKSKGENLP